MRLLFWTLVLNLLSQAQVFGVGPNRFVTVAGSKIIAPDGRELRLRGINLGNWLVQEGYMFRLEAEKGQNLVESTREIHALTAQLVGPAESRAFWKEYYDNFVTKGDIDLIKRAGFNSIRVPFDYKLLTPEDYPGVWLGPGFEFLDRVVRWAREAGLYVILDMHCAPGGQSGANIDDSWGYSWLYESPECQDRVAQVWRKLAERYASEPTVLGYDLMNEPVTAWPKKNYDADLEPLLKRITKAIRAVDQNHIVVLEGSVWDTNFKVFGTPFDPKLVYSIHKYWSPTTDETLKEYIDFRDRYHVPLWLGESGENTDEWIGNMVDLAEKEDIGWCFWTYKKMESTSCVVSMDPPAHWDEMVGFAQVCGGVSTKAKEMALLAMPLDDRRAALKDFIAKAQLEHCHVNPGFVQAMRMKTP